MVPPHPIYTSIWNIFHTIVFESALVLRYAAFVYVLWGKGEEKVTVKCAVNTSLLSERVLNSCFRRMLLPAFVSVSTSSGQEAIREELIKPLTVREWGRPFFRQWNIFLLAVCQTESRPLTERCQLNKAKCNLIWFQFKAHLMCCWWKMACKKKE